MDTYIAPKFISFDKSFIFFYPIKKFKFLKKKKLYDVSVNAGDQSDGMFINPTDLAKIFNSITSFVVGV